MKKAQRHEACSTKKPPSTGPSAVVIEVAPDHVPIACPRLSPLKYVLMIARLPGTSNAPPTPCTARATISCPGLGANPHHTEAAVKSNIPALKTRLRPNWSP